MEHDLTDPYVVEQLIAELEGISEAITRLRRRRAEVVEALSYGRHLGLTHDLVVSSVTSTHYTVAVLRRYVTEDVLRMARSRSAPRKAARVAAKPKPRGKRNPNPADWVA